MIPNLLRSAPLFLLASLVVHGDPIAAQGAVFTVDIFNGPGTDFTDLPPAEAAAQPGDILIVRAGEYTPFSTSKGISVLGEPGARIARFDGNVRPGVVVSSLPAGQTFVLRRIVLDPNLPQTDLAVVQGCAGLVLFEDVTAGVLSNSFVGVAVSTSSDVRLHRVQAFGSRGVAVADSRVTITDSTIVGVSSPLDVSRGQALFLERSNVVVAGSDLRGGDATFFGFALPPRPAVHTVNTDLTLTGTGSQTVVAGGGDTTPVSAIVGSGGSLRVHPELTLSSNAGAPTVAPTVPLTFVRVPSLRASGADLGSTVSVELFGTASFQYFLLLGFPGAPTAIPGLGDAGLDLSLPILIVDAGTVPTIPIISRQVFVPDAPVLLGARFCWQAVGGTPFHGFLLSNAVTYAHGR